MARPRRASVGVTAALVILGFAVEADAQVFTDVTAGSGLARRGIKDGGLTWADFDGDGFLDVLVNTSGRSHLYFQRPGADPAFEEVTDTSAPGLSRIRGERSAVAGDFNNDGLVDFARTDQELLEVYLNRGPPDFRFGDPMTGDPDFVENAITDPTGQAYEGLGIFDYDDDGWLDLVMDEDPVLRIYLNPGDGSAAFTIVDPAITGLPTDPAGEGDYLAVTDWDRDGLVDILHRNEGGRDLWHREADGTWTPADLGDLSSASSGRRRGGAMFCDIDNDGDFDAFYTSGSGTGINRAWLQNAMGVFEDSGLPDISGTDSDDVLCGDVDNDGDLDLYYSQNSQDVLVLNQLADTGTLGYVRDDGYGDEDGEGATFVDYDRDGDLDLYVNQWGGSVTDPMTMMSMETPADNQLFRNDTDDDRYLAVTVLAGIAGCPTPTITRTDIGAWARLETTDWQSGAREVNGGQGHGSQGSPVLHFGLGSDPSEEHVLTIGFVYGDQPTARIRVTPAALGAYQHLAVVSTDADGDSIPTSLEVSAASANPDPDGDGFEAWNDDDSDGDGVLDVDEAGTDPCGTLPDADGDGLPDFLDDSFDVAPDGGFPDATVRPDASDAGADTAGPSFVQVHGGGCIACSVARHREDGRGALLASLVLLLGLLHRRLR